MPTYEYRCKDCGHELEVVQSFTEEALTVCPACSGALRKVYGAVGISFKGTGFYKTDSRSGSSKSASSSSTKSTADTSSGSGSSASTDSGSSSGSSGSADTGSSSKSEASTAASTAS